MIYNFFLESQDQVKVDDPESQNCTVNENERSLKAFGDLSDDRPLLIMVVYFHQSEPSILDLTRKWYFKLKKNLIR